MEGDVPFDPQRLSGRKGFRLPAGDLLSSLPGALMRVGQTGRPALAFAVGKKAAWGI